jgi:hypothetical protein
MAKRKGKNIEDTNRVIRSHKNKGEQTTKWPFGHFVVCSPLFLWLLITLLVSSMFFPFLLAILLSVLLYFCGF